ncbi:MAG TPA: MFS transporter, partial [Thermomicrobiales bacterium]|nr:MFS transporter [Thermomicrobiales bacterium]
LLAWQLMVVLDGTIVNIALTHIRGSLGFSETGLSWVVNAYALAFGGLLLLGGRAGDILGRRRVLVIGVLIFTFASFLGGIAPNAELLLSARVLQGIGAAIAAPSTLSLIIVNFHEPADRNRALSLFSSISGVGASIGLIMGGVLTSWLSWHWVFFVNIPIGLAVAFLAPRTVTESPRVPGKFDLVGALTSTVGVTSLVYGFIRASEEGWTDLLTLGAFALAVVLLVGFVLIEARAAQPIMPLRLLANRNRLFGYMNMLLVPSAMFGLFFFLTQFLQNVLGFSPLRTGVAFLPLSASIITISRFAPRLVARFSARNVMSAGATLLVIALLWLSRVNTGSGYFQDIVAPVILLGLGAGLSFTPLTMTILSNLDPRDSGSASGLLQTMQQIGGAVGLAVLVTVFGTASRNATGDGKSPLEAMTHGTGQGFLTAAGLAVIALLIAIFGISRIKKEQPEATTAPSAEPVSLH